MFEFANSSVLEWLTTQNVTYEDHTSGVEPNHFAQRQGLVENLDILATTTDRGGRPYVAIIQGKTLPIYAVQFHPEKVRYVQNQYYMHNIPKTPHARAVSDDLARFFVAEVRE